LKKSITKNGLVEWLKVKALSSNPSTAKKRKKRNERENLCDLSVPALGTDLDKGCGHE
jgi:ribosomal protein S21